jgi:hypothetical protein
MNENLNEAISIRSTGSKLSWSLVVAGLFALVTTISTVTLFAMSHAGMPIYTAALIDPLLSVPLIVCIIADGIMSRHGLKPTKLSTFAKWFTGILALACNIWSSFGVPAAMMIHAIPVAIVILLAAMVPGMRRRFHDLSTELDARARQELEAARSLSNKIEYQTGPLTPDEETILSPANLAPVSNGAVPADRVDTAWLDSMKDKTVKRSDDDLEKAAKLMIDTGELKPQPSIYALQKTLNIGANRATGLKQKVNGYAVLENS